MPKPRRLSGAEVVTVLKGFGFVVESQRGSHIKLARMADGEREVLTIANHKELKKGTVVALFKQASRFISESELREYFYSD
jgi:predicted RNA binding protein YcfA (HicA-like mRNA interferase family)